MSQQQHQQQQPQLTAYDPRVLKTFVQNVSRAFYDSAGVIILDQLLKREVYRDDELSQQTSLTIKDLRNVIGPLIADRLVNTMSRPEHKPGPPVAFARPVNRTYYWLDPKEFSDVVRWRMNKLYKTLDNKLRTEQENKGYLCPDCHRTYLPMDVPMNFGPTGSFLCDSCGGELVDNDEVEGALQEGKDKMASFNAQTTWIQEGLRKTSEMIFPAFDIHVWLAENGRSGEAFVEGGATAVKVELQSGDDAAKALAQQKLAAAQRTQNVIPSWHLYSTISGQQTALGIQHAALNAASSSGSALGSTGVEVVNEKHATALEEYYASLRSTEPDAQSHPSTSASGDLAVKAEPLDASLDVMNAHGKRARSASAPMRSPTPPPHRADDGETVGGSGSGVMVSVAGVQKSFDDVTEEDQELMTPDEYTAYFEVWSELNS